MDTFFQPSQLGVFYSKIFKAIADGNDVQAVILAELEQWGKEQKQPSS